MSLSSCKFINIPIFKDKRGSLSFLQSFQNIPFNIQRIYYIYDVPEYVIRGNHAHKNLEQLFVPINGCFDIKLDDGSESMIYHLDSNDKGLYVSSMIWRQMFNFSKNSICLVIASEMYSEDDYIRDYEEFVRSLDKS